MGVADGITTKDDITSDDKATSILRRAPKKAKSLKAPRPAKVRMEFLKYDSENVVEYVVHLNNF